MCLLLVRVLRRVSLERCLGVFRSLDLDGRHRGLLFHDSVREDDRLPGEEIQHAIVDLLHLCPEFPYAIPQVLGVWAAQPVAVFSEELNPGNARESGLFRYASQVRSGVDPSVSR